MGESPLRGVPARRCGEKDQSDRQDHGYFNTNSFVTKPQQQLLIVGIQIRAPYTSPVTLKF